VPAYYIFTINVHFSFMFCSTLLDWAAWAGEKTYSVQQSMRWVPHSYHSSRGHPPHIGRSRCQSPSHLLSTEEVVEEEMADVYAARLINVLAFRDGLCHDTSGPPQHAHAERRGAPQRTRRSSGSSAGAFLPPWGSSSHWMPQAVAGDTQAVLSV
jgi:hypothetical protein